MQNPLPDSAGKRYVKQPVVIEAMQWTGDNIQELWDWVGAGNLYGPVPEEHDGEMTRAATPAKLWVAANGAWLDLEIGEWIIRDKLGFYPCKDSVFAENYAPEDGSGILVVPPGIKADIARFMSDPAYSTQSIYTQIIPNYDPSTVRDLVTVRVTHAVDVTGVQNLVRREPSGEIPTRILIQNGKDVG